MAKSAHEEFRNLDPALQERIRRTFKICGVWFGFILLGAVAFVASKPYLDRKREEREKQPGFIRPYTIKDSSRPYGGFSKWSIGTFYILTALFREIMTEEDSELCFIKPDVLDYIISIFDSACVR